MQISVINTEAILILDLAVLPFSALMRRVKALAPEAWQHERNTSYII